MAAPWDDIAKAILKQISGKKNQKVRYEFAKKSGTLGAKNPSSPLRAKKAPAKKAPAKKAPAKPKSSSGSRQQKKTGITPTGKNVGRIAKTRPEPKRRDFVSKNSGIMKNDAERRAASRMGNRTLRRDGYLSGAGNKSTSKDMPVNVRGSVIKPPSKATMRPPKQRGGDFESDEMLRQFRNDLRSGLGRSSKNKKK